MSVSLTVSTLRDWAEPPSTQSPSHWIDNRVGVRGFRNPLLDQWLAMAVRLHATDSRFVADIHDARRRRQAAAARKPRPEPEGRSDMKPGGTSRSGSCSVLLVERSLAVAYVRVQTPPNLSAPIRWQPLHNVHLGNVLWSLSCPSPVKRKLPLRHGPAKRRQRELARSR